MFQLDDKFLQDVGLGNLPDEQKQAFLQYFREQLELRVGTKLSDGLSDGQLEEFESFVDRDADKVDTWIQAHVPNYREDTVYQQLREGAPENIEDDIVLAEYASLKWLGLNRPDYRDVVAATMAELKDETAKNRNAIVGGADPSSETPEQPEA